MCDDRAALLDRRRPGSPGPTSGGMASIPAARWASISLSFLAVVVCRGCGATGNFHQSAVVQCTTMELTTCMLADAAQQTPDGKVHVLGGQWDRIVTAGLPTTHPSLAIVLVVRVEYTEALQRYEIRVELAKDGELMGPASIGHLQVGHPPTLAPGASQSAAIALTFPMVTFATAADTSGSSGSTTRYSARFLWRCSRRPSCPASLPVSATADQQLVPDSSLPAGGCLAARPNPRSDAQAAIRPGPSGAPSPSR